MLELILVLCAIAGLFAVLVKSLTSTSSSQARGFQKISTKRTVLSSSSVEANGLGDRYSTLEEVTHALKSSGLESSNLIVAVDYTKSNLSQVKIFFVLSDQALSTLK